MPLLGGIGELYLLCAGLGSLFIIVSFLTAQMHVVAHHGAGAEGAHALDGHSGHAGDAGGGHLSAGPHHGPALHGPPAHDPGAIQAGAGHGAGGAGAHGHAGGAPPGHGGASDQPGGQSFRGQLARGLEHGGHFHFPEATGAHHAAPAHTGSESGPVATATGVIPRPLRILITLFSPMTFAMFSAFFGISGFLLLSHFPYLGSLTAIPAAVIAFAITRFTLGLMGLVVRKLEGRFVQGTEQFIGHMATVSVGIGAGGMGQIIYTIGGMRGQSPARASAPGASFKKGDKVMIADVRDQVAYVEAWTDPFLPDEGGTISLSKETIEQKEEQANTGEG